VCYVSAAGSLDPEKVYLINLLTYVDITRDLVWHCIVLCYHRHSVVKSSANPVMQHRFYIRILITSYVFRCVCCVCFESEADEIYYDCLEFTRSYLPRLALLSS
jgi:hypothetical protein